MKSNNNIVSWAGSAICTAIACMNIGEIENIILLTIGILSGIVSLAFDIYLWYKKAHADKKITTDEVKNLKDTISDDTKNISDIIENSNKKEDK